MLDWLELMVSLAPKDLVADSGDAKTFFALVDKALVASASRDLLIHVHGSNNTLPRPTSTRAVSRTTWGATWISSMA